MPETFLSKLIAGAVLFLFGALVTQFWTRFRGRLATLSWTATSSRLAVSSEPNPHAKLEVLYNGQRVNNVHLVTIFLRNESTKDLTNVMVNLAFSDGSAFLISEGQLIGSLKPLLVDAKFMSDWLALANQTPLPAEVAYYGTRRDYPLAVFNRGAVARFDAFVTRSSDGNNPMVSLAVDHEGVQVRNRPPVAEFFGVQQSRAQIIGLVLAAALTALAIRSPIPVWGVGLAGLVVGLVALLLGASAVRLVRAILKILS